MNKNVIVIGASGHGRVIADIVAANGDTVIGFLDDDPEKNSIGALNDWEKYADAEFIIGIGDNSVRNKISQHMRGANWYTAIHPSAIVSPSAEIDKGTVVMPNAVINAGTVVGRHCIINSGAIVEHDNRIEDYCHISVGAKLGGTVSIGPMTWIGIGAVICNNLSICENCMVGAGAVVIHNIVRNGTYVGVPAKFYL